MLRSGWGAWWWPSMAILRGAIIVAAATLAGCAPVSGSPTTWFGGPYQITVSQMYDPNAPDALLAFKRDPSGAAVTGTLVGKIHGWPFPHTDSNGDFGENLFTYAIDFTVTRTEPGNPSAPLAARGIRRVYFHPDRVAASIADAGSFSSGKAVIVDSVELGFKFGPAPGEVQVTTIQRQTNVIPFEYDGEQVTPPNTPEMTAAESGTWSANYGAYIFR